ncbi:hypothetical protein [Bacteroides mediterraneensis]|uniref:hypothetical protein n=1 Tax=Bacteroides mediterraneensis TaxID=1841856 RepID=UPI001957B1E3|nr:hypothetical protein [Bacteroides mediterraneensis]MBM6781429.1 hypothetical protein [Bacteroides mediterraneensis]
MGVLIGEATTKKDGLAPKGLIPYEYNKNNNDIAKLFFETTSVSHIHASILTICSVSGESLGLYLIVNKWNSTIVSAKVICGSSDTISTLKIRLYYAVESNGNVSLYIQSGAYLRIYVSPQNTLFNPSFSSVSTIPSETIEVTVS